VVDSVGVRLRLSNKARKRLVSDASARPNESPQALAYQLGTECAADRLLLDGRAEDAKTIAAWKAPRLPIGGGALIARGLPEGPIVARTLRAIEDQWVRAGFPVGQAFERIVNDVVARAR
jgi:poly(A) polymerase